MRRSEMSLMDAKAVFEHTDNYPLTVTYQGRTEKLDQATVQALRRAKADFDVDEREVEMALFKYGAC